MSARPRIGDEVHDEVAGKDGVVTDISGERFLLRPPHSFGYRSWYAEDPDRLTLLQSREQRADHWH